MSGEQPADPYTHWRRRAETAEDRVRELEAENVRLNMEMEAYRQKLSPEDVEAMTAVIKALQAAKDSPASGGGRVMSGSAAKWNWRIPRKPDFIIGGAENPYIRRWWVIPRNRFFNIYLHNMLRDDDDRALHDHPWWNVSIILKGGYLEWFSHRGDPVNCVWRKRWAVVFRKPMFAHRLALGHGTGSSWSLFITGPRVREWGFHCPNGWVHWKIFTDPTDSARVGRGCE